MINDIKHRKTLRWQSHNYSSDGRYFLTICSVEKKHIFSRVINGDIFLSPVGKMVDKYINSSNNLPYINVLHYVIMPNHIHILISIKGSEVYSDSNATDRTHDLIPNFITALKRLTNKEFGQNVFHRSYYDRVIRDEDEYNRVVRYIYENPMKWKLDKYYCEENYEFE